jgi:hypothetical protein
MSLSDDPNFRYPNDNREISFDQFDYPSQQKVDPLAKKGQEGYYGNDNGGFYANSNREDISTIDHTNKKQPPNSNYKIS